MYSDTQTDLRELIREIVLDDLDTVHAVASIHATAQQIDIGIKRAMPCYDTQRCSNQRCGECGQ